MIRIVVNSPKGGVGKTTLSTNIALLLARKGKRVWALDLAQGMQMSADLLGCPEFDEDSPNKVEEREAEELPSSFPGAKDFDYLVVDTDDYFKIPASILDPERKGWRVICPLVEHDPKGMRRIKREIREVAIGALLAGQTLRLSVVVNNHAKGDGERAREDVFSDFQRAGLGSLVSACAVPHSDEPDPFFLEDGEFQDALIAVLVEIGENI